MPLKSMNLVHTEKSEKPPIMTILSSLMISAKSILVRDLNTTSLEDLYGGLPYRYNSIIDLIFQNTKVKNSLLEKLKLKDRLFYKVFILSNSSSSLPVLECLEIDGFLGGMLSTYLHDLDREMIEGMDDIFITSRSMFIWRILMQQSEFSFIFPASRNPHSRTSIYMKQIGFNEKRFDDLRCFFNGFDNSSLFVDLMRELISSIENTNKLYSFNHERFREAKVQQARIAKHWFSTSNN